MRVEWNLFDPDAPSRVSRRNMPHIDMSGTLTFVTFRLGDSMPRNVVRKWHAEIEEWLTEHDLHGHSVEEVLANTSISDELKSDLRRFKNRRWHGHLDDCHGSCLLRDAATRWHVEQTLLHFEGVRYDLERFVIMPNHVHALIQMRTGVLLRKQFTQLLRYSARQINSHLNRKGYVWQSEPFDHVVRSEAQLEYLQRYISENPKKALLGPDQYTLWVHR